MKLRAPLPGRSRKRPEAPTEPQTRIGQWLEARLQDNGTEAARLLAGTARGRVDWWDPDEAAVAEAAADLAVRNYRRVGASAWDVADVVLRAAREAAPGDVERYPAVVAFLTGDEPRPDLSGLREIDVFVTVAAAVSQQAHTTPEQATLLVVEAEELAMLRGFGPALVDVASQLDPDDDSGPDTEMGRRLAALLPPRRAPVTKELLDDLQRIVWGRNLLTALTRVVLAERFPRGLVMGGRDRVAARFPETREDPDGHRYIAPQAAIVAAQSLAPRPARINVPVPTQIRIRLRIVWICCEWLGIDTEARADQLLRAAERRAIARGGPPLDDPPRT